MKFDMKELEMRELLNMAKMLDSLEMLEMLDTIEFIVNNDFLFAYREFCDEKDTRYFIVEYRDKKVRVLAIKRNRPFVRVYFEDMLCNELCSHLYVIELVKGQCDVFFQQECSDDEDAREEDYYDSFFEDKIITSSFENGIITVKTKDIV